MEPFAFHASSMAAIVIDLNASFFIQLGLILALIFILKHLIFEPFLKAEDERFHKTTAQLESAQQLHDRALALDEECRLKLAKARALAATERKQLLKEAVAEREKLVSEAQKQSEQSLEDARARLDAECAQARSEIETEAAVLADAIQRRYSEGRL